MKKINSILPVLLICCSAYGQSYSVPASDEGRLIIDVYDADIRVTGVSGQKATINFLKRNSKNPLSSGKTPHYDVDVTGNDIRIFKKSSRRIKDVLIEVQVPVGYRCDLYTYFGKKIEVSGITGNVDVRNHFGEIIMDDIGGKVTAESFEGNVIINGISTSAQVHNTEGDIMVSFSDISPGFNSGFSSNKGNITISLPEDAALMTGTDTFRGKIDTQFAWSIPTALHASFNPKLSYRTINGGDSDALLTIMNHFGDISLNKLSK